MITILRPDDWHCHFRDGDILETVLPHHASIFNRCLVMPNVPQILNYQNARDYHYNIKNIHEHFRPIMTIMLTDETTTQTIKDLEESEYTNCYIKACKLYPKGVTTGVSNVRKLGPIFEQMQKQDLVLCIHAEEPTSFILDREKDYIHNIKWITNNFPGLRVVVEHVSTERMVDFISESSVNVAGTITAHHLILTLDDVLANGIKPHNFCYPVAKTVHDRYILRLAVSQGNKKFFFGSDSAPHLKGNKENSCGCAGIFMPGIIALNILLDIFSNNIKSFTAINGATFYKMPVTTELITLKEESWTVPQEYDGIVPFMAGKTMRLSC